MNMGGYAAMSEKSNFISIVKRWYLEGLKSWRVVHIFIFKSDCALSASGRIAVITPSNVVLNIFVPNGDFISLFPGWVLC